MKKLALRDEVNIMDYKSIFSFMDLSASSLRMYGIGVDLFMDWFGVNRSCELKELTVYDYIEYKRWLSGKGYSNSTMNIYLGGLICLYKHLERYGFENITEGVKLFDTDGGRNIKDGVSMDEWKRLLSMIDTKKFNGKKHYLIIYMLFTTGVRQMSLRELKWGDFGFNSKVNSLVMNVRLKGVGNRRDLKCLSSECVRILEEYKFMYNKHYGLNSVGEMEELDKDWYVFGIKDRMISDVGMRKITREWLRKAGIYKEGEVTGHGFRHGIAEHLLEVGMEMTSVQMFLGHRSLASTRIYAGKKEKEIVDKKIMEKLNGISINDFI